MIVALATIGVVQQRRPSLHGSHQFFNHAVQVLEYVRIGESNNLDIRVGQIVFASLIILLPSRLEMLSSVEFNS